MPLSSEILEQNKALADRINEEARANPASPYAGKYVGIANGQVVAVAETLGEVAGKLRQLESDPSRCFIVEASRDYNVAEYNWN